MKPFAEIYYILTTSVKSLRPGEFMLQLCNKTEDGLVAKNNISFPEMASMNVRADTVFYKREIPNTIESLVTTCSLSLRLFCVCLTCITHLSHLLTHPSLITAVLSLSPSSRLHVKQAGCSADAAL